MIVQEASSFPLKPLLSSGSIEPITETPEGADGAVDVSGSFANMLTGPAITEDLFASSQLSLTVTFTHLGAKLSVWIDTFVDVPT